MENKTTANRRLAALGVGNPNKDQVAWISAFPNVHLRQLFPNAAKRRTVMRNFKE